MIILEHRNGEVISRIFWLDGEDIPHGNKSISQTLWSIAKAYPEELICWCESSLVKTVDFYKFKNSFLHKRMMQSCQEHQYLPATIGYVEPKPFIKINPKVTYPTWQMSILYGAVFGKVLLKLEGIIDTSKPFGYVLNSIGKLARLHGVFCYAKPNLIKKDVPKLKKASLTQMFTFVHQHYKTRWCFLLLLCFWKFEGKNAILPFILGFFSSKINTVKVDFTSISNHIHNGQSISSLDVIIPTIGRPAYLYNFLTDLAEQTILPKQVIIVEQNPDVGSQTELNYLTTESWPFKIKHHFIHKVGACQARNMALKEVTADWVFLADDDNRIQKNLLGTVIKKQKAIGARVLNLAYLTAQDKELSVIEKQWESFGSGCSFLDANLLKNVSFDEGFEHGYGEDIDFGMQLRNLGADVIYVPTLQIAHLKAPVGGFRKPIKKSWDESLPLPKPSPTIMLYHFKHSTKEQRLGYKLVYMLKQINFRRFWTLSSQLKKIRLAWQKSEFWASKLLKS